MKKIILVILLIVVNTLHAEVFTTVPKAINDLFSIPHETLEKHLYLTPVQMESAKKELSHSISLTSVVTYFDIMSGKKILARAFIDTHIVRTMNENILTTIDTQGNIIDISVLSFLEPKEYAPKKKWLELFKANSTDKIQSIAGITGATLSSDAIKHSLEKVMYLKKVFSL